MAGWSRSDNMSNNAVEAYEEGYMPISKWTKKAMLEALENAGMEPALLEKTSKLRKDEIFLSLFEYKAWHHTSGHGGVFFNETDFYGLSEEALERFTEADVELVVASRPPVRRAGKKEKAPSKNGRWVAEWTAWEGTKRHRRPVEVRECGTVTGAMFKGDDSGANKRLSGGNFRLLCRVEEVSPRKLGLRGVYAADGDVFFCEASHGGSVRLLGSKENVKRADAKKAARRYVDIPGAENDERTVEAVTELLGRDEPCVVGMLQRLADQKSGRRQAELEKARKAAAERARAAAADPQRESSRSKKARERLENAVFDRASAFAMLLTGKAGARAFMSKTRNWCVAFIGTNGSEVCDPLWSCGERRLLATRTELSAEDLERLRDGLEEPWRSLFKGGPKD